MEKTVKRASIAIRNGLSLQVLAINTGSIAVWRLIGATPGIKVVTGVDHCYVHIYLLVGYKCSVLVYREFDLDGLFLPRIFRIEHRYNREINV